MCIIYNAFPTVKSNTSIISGFIQQSKEKSLRLTCIICILTGLINAVLGRDSFPYLINMIVLSSIFGIALLFIYLHKLNWSGYFIPVATTLLIIEMSIGFGSALGVQHYLIISLVGVTIHHPKSYYRIFGIIGVISAMVLIRLIQQYQAPYYPLPALTPYFFAVNICLPYVIAVMLCWNLVKQALAAQKVIEQQKEVLLEAVQFKDKVLSIIGHDMRAPFISTKGMLELLEKDLLPEREKTVFYKQLHDSIDVSLQTLDNLLKWSSQSQQDQHKKLKSEKLDLFEVIEHVILFYQQLSSQKGVTLENRVARGSYVLADAEQIAFVLRNLTSNAIKFSFEGQRIMFSSQIKDDTWVETQIQDEGTGMPEETLSRLFDITKRISTPGTLDEQGTGLGLLFCKEFVENNAGTLTVESEPGKGTRVTFCLKACPAK